MFYALQGRIKAFFLIQAYPRLYRVFLCALRSVGGIGFGAYKSANLMLAYFTQKI